MSYGVRFAPSPTGHFHIGNLRTAWISHWWARALGEPWIVRFEDIDVPRVVEGAIGHQLADMRKIGLVPDEIVVQTQRAARHRLAFERAVEEGRVYPCSCSRKEVRESLERMASAPHGQVPLYSGRCRKRREVEVHDQSEGGAVGWRFRHSESDGSRDFIVGRTDGMKAFVSFVPSYNWACAVDDHEGGYSLIVRAHDLGQVLEGQRAVQQMLGHWRGRKLGLEEEDRAPYPAVYHCALVVQDSGARLEKRTCQVTLEALQENLGLGPDLIAKAFDASFSHPRAFVAPGALLGEAKQTLLLGDLLGHVSRRS